MSYFTQARKFIPIRIALIVCPIWLKFGTRNGIMLLSICGFCEFGTETAAVLARLGLKLNLFTMYQVHTPTNALFF